MIDYSHNSPPTLTLLRRSGIGLKVALCVGGTLLTLLLLWTLGGRLPNLQPVRSDLRARTAAATTGELIKSLRISGTTETLNYAAIRAPRIRGPRDFGQADLTFVKLAAAGSLVEAGSVVAEFEIKRLEDHIRDQLSWVARLRLNLRQRRAQILILQEIGRQERLDAQGRLEKALLDLRLAEVLPRIEAEILENLANEARAIRRQLDGEGRLLESIHAADLRRYALEIEEAIMHVDRHQRDLNNLRVRTPVGGMVVRETIFNRSGQFAQVNVGDRVNPGTPFMRIVDLSQMVVSASVNQVDAQAIRIGSEAVVEFDAYPGLRFSARVAHLAAVASAGAARSRFSLGNTGDFVRHIPTRILIEDKDDRIVPDLSATADVRLASGLRGVLVPREALRREEGPEFGEFVCVVAGGGYLQRRVSVLDVSDTEVLIQSGLEPGERVLLSSLPSGAGAVDYGR